MDQFLSEYYGTAAPAQETESDELEKMAQLTLLAKEAAAEGVDLAEFSDEELVKLAEELYGGEAPEGEAAAAEEVVEEAAEAAPESAELEKEAAAKFEEADFLGRVMAHSFNQELHEIEKEASAKGALQKAYQKTLGRVGAKAEQAVRDRSTGAGFKKEVARQAEKAEGAPKSELLQRAQEAIDRKARIANVAAQVATGAGAAGAAGVGAAALKDKKSADVAFDALVQQRALEHLEAAGYEIEAGQEKTAADEFAEVVDRAALELLEANGYPVEWSEQE
jgi:hypothetical protein